MKAIRHLNTLCASTITCGRNLLSALILLHLSLTLFGQDSITYRDTGLQTPEKTRKVSGMVTDSKGEPLAGVAIKIKGSQKGTITNMEGAFALYDVALGQVLVISYLGTATQEILVEEHTLFNISLKTKNEAIDDLVVVGYGTLRKIELTGSISSIQKDSYKDHPVSRLDQIIQGRTAGVNVTNMSGSPGGELTLRIRGPNSINFNNDPLFVIDGFVGADFRDLCPDDIATIQILKDAAATAVYGNRGANGVILITTRLGQLGKPRISVSSRFIRSTPIKGWDLLDAASFAELANERALYDTTRSILFTDEQIAHFRKHGGTNWEDKVLREAHGQEYNINYSGANDKTAYHISANFLNQEGVLKNSYFKHYTLHANVKSSLSRKLDTDFRMNYSHRATNNTWGAYGTGGPMAGILGWAPTMAPYDANGDLTIRDTVSSIYPNPIEQINSDRILLNNSLLATSGMTYTLFKGLTARIDFGMNYRNSQNKEFSSSIINQNTEAFRQSQDNLMLQNTNSLEYSRTLRIFHRISITGVLEHQYAQTEGFSTRVYGLYFPDQRVDITSTASDTYAEVIKSKETTRSFIVRGNYSFKDKYLLSLSGRTDGSSKFYHAHRYEFFPSVGLGWRISEETFMRQQSIINNLKFRTSFGKTGSLESPPFGTQTLYQTSQQEASTSFTNNSLSPGIIIGNRGNPNLKWETTRQFNIGLDASAWNNQLALELDYFKKNTTDLILIIPLPGYLGGENILSNEGAVVNSGYEISLTAFTSEKKTVRLASNVNAAFLNNEVTNIGSREVLYFDPDAGSGLTLQPEMIIQPGHSIATYYGLRYLGTWKSWEAEQAARYGNVPGDSRYEDIDKDGDIDLNDYQPIGSALPKTLLGWNNTIDYKNLSINIFFQSVLGYDKWNFAYAVGVADIGEATEITHTDIEDRWVAGTNEDSDIPAFSASDETEIQSSRFLERGDFLRLKNLSITYHLPKTLARNISGSIQLSASNLWTLTRYKGLDPESFSVLDNSDSSRGIDAGSYPNAKHFSMGIKLSF